MDERLRRAAALEERRRKLDELKRLKEQPTVAPQIALSGESSTGAPSAIAAPAAPAVERRLEPLLSDLLAGPNLPGFGEEHPGASHLAEVAGVVSISLTHARVPDARALRATRTFDTGVQTEEENEALDAVASAPAALPSADAPAIGTLMGEHEASAIFQDPRFTSFLGGAAAQISMALGVSRGVLGPEVGATFAQSRHPALGGTVPFDSDDLSGEDGAYATPLRTVCVLAAPTASAVNPRAVMDIAWSQHAASTLCACYAAASGQGNAGRAAVSSGAAGPSAADRVCNFADGVLVWNLHSRVGPVGSFSLWATDTRPRTGQAPSDGAASGVAGGEVCCVRFHPHAPSLLLGGTSRGQVVVWDARASGGGRGPVAISGFSARGHCAAITGLLVTGSQAATSSLLSFSADGRQCTWAWAAGTARLGDPAASTRLSYAAEGKDAAPRDLCTACASAAAGADVSRVYVGGAEGGLYTCQFTGAACVAQHRVAAHYAQIAAVAAHPSRDAPLLLTASFDGTVKLWSIDAREPELLHAFDGPLDYATDVAWSPSHAAVFASGDLSGTVRLYHLLRSTSDPVATLETSRQSGGGDAGATCAITRLRWSPDGRYLAVGSVDGTVRILEPQGDLVTPGRSEEAHEVFAVLLGGRAS